MPYFDSIGNPTGYDNDQNYSLAMRGALDRAPMMPQGSPLMMPPGMGGGMPQGMPQGMPPGMGAMGGGMPQGMPPDMGGGVGPLEMEDMAYGPTPPNPLTNYAMADEADMLPSQMMQPKTLAEYDAPNVALMMGGAPGGGQMTPFGSGPNVMKDVLRQRAQERMTASQRFQAGAQKING